VSAAELAEVGVRLAEVGHAERRRWQGETDEVVAAKTAAAMRHGLTPVVCVGEVESGHPADAARESVRQLRSALTAAPIGRVIVAYEPVWAIGAAAPAPPAHIRASCAALAAELTQSADRAGSTVIYGGSAGPGLLAALGDTVDGLFLGRRAHDPAGLLAVLDEAAALSDTRVRRS
jgi:triosephosphate isomerase